MRFTEGTMAARGVTKTSIECPAECSLDFLARPIPDTEWLAEEFLPKAIVMLFTGREGCFKTWLVLMLAVAIAQGSEWFKRVCESAKVLYIDAENPNSVFHSRLRAIGGSKNLYLWRWGEDDFPTELDDPRLIAASKHYRLIVIDTLKRFMSGLDENSSKDMAVITQQMRELTKHGASVIAIHHSGKDATKGGYRGSTELGAGVDLVLAVERSDSDGQPKVMINTQKTRYAEEPQMAFNVRKTPAKPMFQLLGELPRAAKEKTTMSQLQTISLVINTLHSLYHKKPTQSDIVGYAKELGAGSRNTILRRLISWEGQRWRSQLNGSTRIYETITHCPPGQTPKKGDGLDNSKITKSIQSSTIWKPVEHMHRSAPQKTREEEEVVNLVD